MFLEHLILQGRAEWLGRAGFPTLMSMVLMIMTDNTIEVSKFSCFEISKNNTYFQKRNNALKKEIIDCIIYQKFYPSLMDSRMIGFKTETKRFYGITFPEIIKKSKIIFAKVCGNNEFIIYACGNAVQYISFAHWPYRRFHVVQYISFTLGLSVEIPEIKTREIKTSDETLLNQITHETYKLQSWPKPMKHDKSFGKAASKQKPHRGLGTK